MWTFKGDEVVKYIAVKDMELSFLPFTNPEWQILTPESQNVTIDDKGVYFGAVQILLTKATPPSGTFVAAAPVTLNGTAQFVMVDNQPVLLEGDYVQGTATVQVGSSSSSLPFTCKIDKAGQTSVEGE